MSPQLTNHLMPLALEAAPSGMLMISSDGNIQLVNSKVEELFGYSRAELLTQPIEILIPERLRQNHRQLRESFLADPQARPMGQGRDLFAARQDGSEFPVEIGLNPLTTAEDTFVLVSINDITERQKLEQANQLLVAIIESSDDAIISQDLHGIIGSWNQSAERIFGYSEEEIIGQSMARLYPSDRPHEEKEILARLLRGERVDHIETVRVRKDGKLIDISVTLSPIHGPRGGVVGASMIARDISLRKNNEQQIAVIQAISRVLLVSKSVQDASSRILQIVCEHLDWNIGAIWEVDREAGVLNCLEIWHLPIASLTKFAEQTRGVVFAPDVGLVGRVWSRKETAWIPDISCDDNFPRRQAALDAGIQCGMAFPLIANNEVSGVIEFFSSSSRQADTQLFETLGSLGSQIGQFIEQKRAEDELQLSMAAAEVANLAKSKFLANMSHEIRTPLSAILGYADILKDPRLSQTDKSIAVQAIYTNGTYLLLIINDILDLAQVESGKIKLNIQPCSPWQLVKEAVALVRNSAEQKNLVLDVCGVGRLPGTILTDSPRVRQILTNFLSNAVKFTNPGRRIVVRVTAPRSPASLRFEVEDEGIGMSQEELGRVFTPFEQADGSSTRKYGGTGLGLSISKQLSDALGGEIQASSVLGQGSRFVLILSLPDNAEIDWVDASQLESVLSPEQPGTFATRLPTLTGRVLLVEDNHDLQHVLTYFLNRAGLQVEIAENGNLAIQKMLSGAFDVILMDMQMPVLDGYDATIALRDRGYGGPIIALTAHAMLGDRDAYSSCGFTSYLTKPVHSDELVTTIAGYLPAEQVLQPTASPGDGPPLVARETDGFQLQVQEYARNLSGQINSMRPALNSGHLSLLSSLAHQIRGAAGMYGLMTVSETAGLLEDAVEEHQDVSLLRELIEELESAVHRNQQEG